MASGVRFKTFAGHVDDAREVVKGQTTIKVITKDGESQVQTVFADEDNGEFVLVCKDLLDDGVDQDDPEALTEWRAERADEIEAAKPKRGRGRPPGSKNKPKEEEVPAPRRRGRPAKKIAGTTAKAKRPSSNRRKVRRAR